MPFYLIHVFVVSLMKPYWIYKPLGESSDETISKLYHFVWHKKYITLFIILIKSVVFPYTVDNLPCLQYSGPVLFIMATSELGLCPSLQYYCFPQKDPGTALAMHTISHVFLIARQTANYWAYISTYRKVSNIRRTKSQNLNVSRLIL